MSARLGAIGIADAEVEVEAAMNRLAAQVEDRAAGRAELEAVHGLLMRATVGPSAPPLPLLERVAARLDESAAAVVDGLAVRPRVVMRLLASRALDAAWAVLVDNAVGVVADEYDGSTATGQPRAGGQLPLVTHVEPPRVLAWLPGFRDPRYAAPDDCYDITDRLRLRHRLDTVWPRRDALLLGGWASIDQLATSEADRVTLRLVGDGGATLRLAAQRRRRPDLVSGTGAGLTRRAWAGWCVAVDPAPLVSGGPWSLELDVAQQGIRRSRPVSEVGELTRGALLAPLGVGRRQVRLSQLGKQPVQLALAEEPGTG